MSRTAVELLVAAHERLAATTEAARCTAAVREVGRSDHDEVHAVVDGTGALVDLWLAPGSCSLDPGLLGELVVVAAARAEQAARQRCLTIMALAEGDVVAARWEQLCGPSPARAGGWDPVGDRLGTAATAAPQPAPATTRTEDPDDDVLAFDFSSLRSDRG